MMPGSTLHRVAARICSRKTLERVVEPTIADFQKEFASASATDLLRRTWILLSGYSAILKVIAICAGSISVASDAERRTLTRALTWSLALIAGLTGLLILPPLYGFDDAIRGWYAAATIVPQAVPLAIPIGFAFGLAFGLSGRPAMTTAKVMLLGALTASVLSFGILAWAMPAGNQAFREMAFHELRTNQGTIAKPRKAYNEMTLSELRDEVARLSANGERSRARQYAFRFHFRFSLAAATLALAGFLLAAPVDHRGLRGLAASFACFAYWALIFLGESGSRLGYLTAPLGAWLPNIALIGSALLIASSRLSGPPRAAHGPT